MRCLRRVAVPGVACAASEEELPREREEKKSPSPAGAASRLVSNFVCAFRSCSNGGKRAAAAPQVQQLSGVRTSGGVIHREEAAPSQVVLAVYN